MRIIQFSMLFSVLLLPGVLKAEEGIKVTLVAISVMNIDSSAAWYHKYLGFDVVEKKNFSDRKMQIAVLKNNGVRIELVQLEKSVRTNQLIPNLKNPAIIQGYGKVAYEVMNIKKTVRMMKSNGVQFLRELGISRVGQFAGYKVCIVLDCDSNWVQLYGR